MTILRLLKKTSFFTGIFLGTFSFILIWNDPIYSQNKEDLEQLIRESKTRAALVQNVQKAVVHIKVEKILRDSQGQPLNNPYDLYNEEFFKRFFPGIKPPKKQPGQPFRQEGMGSGTIINEEGFILTNHHVVGEADRILVKLYDGKEVKAKIVGTDPESDIAVIKIKGNGYSALTIGDSKELLVGESVIAVGNPFGLTQTVTYGIVSAKGRTNVGINEYENFIQTDAAINPGNSGGPLVNLRGEIIGVNSAIYSRSGGYQGIGFAVPINMAKRIMDELINKGTVSRGWLGVGIQDVTQDLAQAFNLENAKGSLITGVMSDTPADRAGLQRGDVVVEMNGEEVLNSRQFRNEIANSGAGTNINLKVIRNSELMNFRIHLDERPRELGKITMKPDRSEENLFGFRVAEITQEDVSKLNLESSNGVLIQEVKPGSLASDAGLTAGMVIQEINRQPIKSIAEFNQLMEDSSLEKGILLLIVSEGNARYVNLKQQE